MGKDFKEPVASSTTEAAVAFVEDMACMRALVAKRVPSPKETRDLSVTLRRLLVNNEISHIARGRRGRVSIVANNFSNAYELEREGWISYFIGGSDHALGPTVHGASLPLGSSHEPFQKRLAADPPRKKIELTIDAFIKQRVVFLVGTWIDRRQVIKHAAIFGSAAHSKTPKTREELIVARLRNSLVVRPDGDDACKLELDDYWNNHNPREHTKFVYRSNCLNGMQMQLLATATCLASSPDIIDLEEIIRAEIC